MTLPRAPHPYKPPITSQGTSLLFCAMSITVIVYPSHRLEACFENRREKQNIVVHFVQCYSNLEIIEKPGKILLYILRTEVLFK